MISMKTYTIIGGVNGVGKSCFPGVLKARPTNLFPYYDKAEFYDNDNSFVKIAEYHNGEFRTIDMRSPNWILDLQNYLKA